MFVGWWCRRRPRRRHRGRFHRRRVRLYWLLPLALLCSYIREFWFSFFVFFFIYSIFLFLFVRDVWSRPAHILYSLLNSSSIMCIQIIRATSRNMCVFDMRCAYSLSLSRCVQRAHMYRAPIGSSPFASLVIVGCCFFFLLFTSFVVVVVGVCLSFAFLFCFWFTVIVVNDPLVVLCT